ncbi:hypothetical protein UFOVP1344_7 [uncultured Caudovirales phage]|uniref:Tail protein n=1 Tax=uncultured Caudovirales phage TaxID=2100421 RepID=A0A6J5S387_9CAUD|nr:hypothetical protein UFOVP1005_7 [uncultured Caudovirales phage]CAB4199684.1 hypothetical protein UFOVP1344_7 [uncultured Caudovirales phage]CAB4218496.1 hypothetical protein UFOVP1602_33 [uncultured Caudovirales phage]
MIDLNSPISFQIGNGTDLDFNTIIGSQEFSGGSTPLSGYVVESVGIGSVQPIGYTDPKATADGIDVAEAYAGRRTVSMLVSVYGQTRQDLYDKMQQLVNMMRFMPRRYVLENGFRQLKFMLITGDTTQFPATVDHAAGYVEAFFLARPLQIPATEASSSQISGNDSLGYSTKMRLDFLLKYPLKYAQDLDVDSTIPINNTDKYLFNHGVAVADAEVLIEATPGTSQTTDVTIVFSLNGVPITLKVTKTLGIDSTLTRSIRIDYKNQIVYERETDNTSGATVENIAQNLIALDSGATFGTFESAKDYPIGIPVKVSITNTNTTAAITTGYKVTVSWREAWY